MNKKLNNSGFAIAGILYTLLVIFLALIFSFLLMLNNRKTILDQIKKDVYNDLSGISISYDVSLTYGSNTEIKKAALESNAIFDLKEYTGTNISCNNGAIPKIENNQFIVSNVTGNTICNINNTLEDAIRTNENTETNIVMISDDNSITTTGGVLLKLARIDLNGNVVTTDTAILINRDSKLYVNDSKKSGYILARGAVAGFNVRYNGELIIDYVEIRSHDESTINNHGVWFSQNCNGCKAEINDANISVKGYAIGMNNGSINSSIKINNGKFYSNETNTIVSNGTDNTIFIYGGEYTNGSTSNSTIVAKNDSKIYLKENNETQIRVSACISFDNSCEMGGRAVVNEGTQNMYINGGTYYGGKTSTVVNLKNGSTYITNAILYNKLTGGIGYEQGNMYIKDTTVHAKNGIVFNSKIEDGGNINICSSEFDVTNIDVNVTSTALGGKINYSSNVIFKNGTNIPSSNSTRTDILNDNYTGTCSA